MSIFLDITKLTRETVGETTKEVSPDRGTTTYDYDKGRLIKKTDATGNIINYAYDDKGRLSQTTDTNNQVLAKYDYDNVSRITKLTDQSGTTAYQYDSANRIIEKLQSINNKQQRTHIFTYHIF